MWEEEEEGEGKKSRYESMDTRRDECGATAAEKHSKKKKKKLPLLSCVCSHVLSHSAALLCRLAAPLSLSCAARLLVTLVRTHVCVCVCVLNLSLSVLWRPCAYRCGWSLLVGRVCVCVCVCVCARSIRLSVYVYVCVCLCARQMFPGRCHCSVFTHTHTHTKED